MKGVQNGLWFDILPESRIAMTVPLPSYSGYLVKKALAPVSFLGCRAHTGKVALELEADEADDRAEEVGCCDEGGAEEAGRKAEGPGEPRDSASLKRSRPKEAIPLPTSLNRTPEETRSSVVETDAGWEGGG